MSYKCIRQHDPSDCGVACLATVAWHYGRSASLPRLRDATFTNKRGVNVLGLVEAAEAMGFSAKGVRGAEDALDQVPLPAIAHLHRSHGDHFVVVHRVGKRRLVLADPAEGVVRVSREAFQAEWTGAMVLLLPDGPADPSFEKETPLWRIARFVVPFKGLLAEALLGALLVTGLGFAFSYFIQILIDHVIPNGLGRTLNILGILMIATILFKGLFGVVREYLTIHASLKVDVSLMVRFYRHLLRLPMRFFDNRQVGEILSRLGDAGKVRTAVVQALLTLFLDTTLLLTAVVIMSAYHWKLALIVLAFTPLHAMVVLLLRKPLSTQQRATMESAAKLEGRLVESVSGIATLKAACREARSAEEAEGGFLEVVRRGFRVAMLGLATRTTGALVGGLGLLTVYWYGSHAVMDGALTLGQLIFFASIVGYIFGPLERLVGLNVIVQDALVAMDRLGDILDVPAESSADAGRRPERLSGDIVFEEVEFGYGNADRVLDGLSLRIPQGAITALVGENGAGKTTAFKLLMNFYEPRAGRITIGSTDLRDLSRSSLRQRIGYVPQEITLFSGTIADNVRLSDPQATQERIEAVCRQVGAHDFIMRLPYRYEARVGERGVNLSGGQRQRLALARALLGDPDILLFDEATHSLDPETEQALHAGLRRWAGRCTIVLISHRLATAALADRIIVIRDGRVAECGSHAELMSSGRHFASFVEAGAGTP